HQVMKVILNKWYQPEKMLQQYLSMSKKIHDLPADANLKSAFRNNTTEVLDTIRFLVFCGVSPTDLDNFNLTDKESFFLELWRELEEDAEDEYDTVKNFHKESCGRSSIIEKMNLINGGRNGIGEEQEQIRISLQQNKIVLHGFYYITPEQQVMFKFLERSGFELVFFQYYDPRFPNTFDFIKSFISDNYGWTDDWNIHTNHGDDGIGVDFLSTFEKEEKTENR